MNLPTVSVVIATYRREKLVLEAVESALSQQGVLVDVVVVDDSGTASAKSAIEGLTDSRVRYLPRAQNSGRRPGVVRNDGAACTNGEFLHFLDDDDRLAEGALAALTGALRARPDVAMAFGRVLPFGDDPEVLASEREYFEKAGRRARKLGGSRSRFAAQLLFGDTCLINSACVIRSAVHAELGGYDVNVPVIEDVDFYLRAGRSRGYVFVDVPVLHYRTGAPSITSAPQIQEQVLVGFRRMYAKYKQTYGVAEFYRLKLETRGLAALAKFSGFSLP